jgi:hypothetical protein
VNRQQRRAHDKAEKEGLNTPHGYGDGTFIGRVDNPVDEVIAAFLDHLENGGPEPSLDHLTQDERTEASELIDLIKDARGVDFYRSRPSLDAVLAGTEFEHQLDSLQPCRRWEMDMRGKSYD